MKQIRNCSSCVRGISNNINSDILCRINGIVSADFICSKYKVIPKIKDLYIQKNRCVDCEFFIINTELSDPEASVGYCHLFTVRCFNGQQKNACSKFAIKSDINAS